MIELFWSTLVSSFLQHLTRWHYISHFLTFLIFIVFPFRYFILVSFDENQTLFDILYQFTLLGLASICTSETYWRHF